MYGIRLKDLVAPVLVIIAPVLVIITASIQPAFAPPAVPAPVVGAGLLPLAVLGGGYWLIKKLRKPR
jgi:hypothetical protein